MKHFKRKWSPHFSSTNNLFYMFTLLFMKCVPLNTKSAFETQTVLKIAVFHEYSWFMSIFQSVNWQNHKYWMAIGESSSKGKPHQLFSKSGNGGDCCGRWSRQARWMSHRCLSSANCYTALTSTTTTSTMNTIACLAQFLFQPGDTT